MTTRRLSFMIMFGVLGWLGPNQARAQTAITPIVPPLVSAHPIYEGTMPGVVGTGGGDSDCQGLTEQDPFSAGSLTFQAMTGYFNHTWIGPGGPALDYAPIGFRLGYILNTPESDHWYRGCFEVLVEANASPIVRTYGTYFAGPNAFLRYNFVQPECIVVPYFQCGAGFVLNDAWRTSSLIQRNIGEAFEFLLRAEWGARVMITECVSFDVEAGFQHISNAGLGRHNGGINNMGGSVGFTYFYGH